MLRLLNSHFQVQIVQVRYWGQTRYTRFLNRKHLIDNYYCIGHRLGFKYLLFTYFSFNAQHDSKWLFSVANCLGWRFAAALLPQLFGKNPRSHHKGATGRVRTEDQRFQFYAIANLDKTSLKIRVIEWKSTQCCKSLRPLNAAILYMAFKHCFSLATVLNWQCSSIDIWCPFLGLVID